MTSASEATGRHPEDEWHPAAPDRVLAAAALGIALALCLPAAAGLSYLFQRVEFYAHGYFIPLVAGYLVYGKRRQIFEALRQLHPPRYGARIAFGASVRPLDPAFARAQRRLAQQDHRAREAGAFRDLVDAVGDLLDQGLLHPEDDPGLHRHSREALGDEVVDHYVHFFRTEQRKCDEAVTSWERARYFERG